MKRLNILLKVFTVPAIAGYMTTFQNPYELGSYQHLILMLTGWIISGLWGFYCGKRIL